MTSYATLKLAHELLYNYDRAVQWNKDIADDWALRILLELEEPPRYLMKVIKTVSWDNERMLKTIFYEIEEIDRLKQLRDLYKDENQRICKT